MGGLKPIPANIHSMGVVFPFSISVLSPLFIAENS